MMSGNSQGSKQTSDRMSELAARVLQMSDFDIKVRLTPSEIRSLAASVLSQDETKGNRLDGQHYPVSES